MCVVMCLNKMARQVKFLPKLYLDPQCGTGLEERRKVERENYDVISAASDACLQLAMHFCCSKGLEKQALFLFLVFQEMSFVVLRLYLCIKCESCSSTE